jgi:hypothetical protein
LFATTVFDEGSLLLSADIVFSVLHHHPNQLNTGYGNPAKIYVDWLFKRFLSVLLLDINIVLSTVVHEKFTFFTLTLNWNSGEISAFQLATILNNLGVSRHVKIAKSVFTHIEECTHVIELISIIQFNATFVAKRGATFVVQTLDITG